MKKWFAYDTTLRDGLQEHGREISLTDAKKYAEFLDQMGFTWLEAGFASAGEEQLKRIKTLAKLKLTNTIVTAFGRTRGKKETVEEAVDLQAILESGVRVATLVGKVRQRDVLHSLETTADNNLLMVAESITYLRSKGLSVIFDAEHYFDGLQDNEEYTISVIKIALKAGADWIVLCDTNGASTPVGIRNGIKKAQKVVPLHKLGFHGHNDRNRAVINSETAHALGVTHIQGTVNGYGERCGNTDFCVLIPNLYFDHNANCLKDRESLKQLTRLSKTTAEYLNAINKPNHPWIGDRAGYTEAGMHASGILRDPSSYIHADLSKVGNEMTFGFSEQSGKSSLAIKAKEMGFVLNKEEIDKVNQILNGRLKEGYNYAAADASLYLLINEAINKNSSRLDPISFRVSTLWTEGKSTSDAMISANLGNNVTHEVGVGNGPVDSLNIALGEVLKKFFPKLPVYKLTDYRVKIVNPEAATAAKVRVIIEFADSQESWSTVGAHENIIEASWIALLEGAKYFLIKQERELSQHKVKNIAGNQNTRADNGSKD